MATQLKTAIRATAAHLWHAIPADIEVNQFHQAGGARVVVTAPDHSYGASGPTPVDAGLKVLRYLAREITLQAERHLRYLAALRQTTFMRGVDAAMREVGPPVPRYEYARLVGFAADQHEAVGDWQRLEMKRRRS